MKDYTVIVTVRAKDQAAAAKFVERAVDRQLEQGGFRAQEIAEEDGSIRVSTPDGTHSVVF